MAKALLKTDEGYKVNQKISAEDFVRLIGKNPSRITISESILKQSKSISLILEALENVYHSPRPPEIEVSQRGRPAKVIRQDWMDPYIRSLVGYQSSSGLSLELKLLAQGSTSPHKALPMGDLAPHEVKELASLREAGHIELTSDLRVYLTDLGADIARGARKIYG